MDHFHIVSFVLQSHTPDSGDTLAGSPDSGLCEIQRADTYTRTTGSLERKSVKEMAASLNRDNPEWLIRPKNPNPS